MDTEKFVAAGAGTGKDSSGLTAADISRATSNFSEKNMVKQGASYSIYKGKLKDGSQVAVKRAKKVSKIKFINKCVNCSWGL